MCPRHNTNTLISCCEACMQLWLSKKDQRQLDRPYNSSIQACHTLTLVILMLPSPVELACLVLFHHVDMYNIKEMNF